MAASMGRASLCQIGFVNICSKIGTRNVSICGKECVNKHIYRYKTLQCLQNLTTLNRQLENGLQRLCIRSCASSPSSGDGGSLANNSEVTNATSSFDDDSNNSIDTTLDLKKAVEIDKGPQSNKLDNTKDKQEEVDSRFSSSEELKKQREPLAEEIVDPNTKKSKAGVGKYTKKPTSTAYTRETKGELKVDNKHEPSTNSANVVSRPHSSGSVSVSEKEEKVNVEFEDGPDTLYKQIDLVIKGHDREVLNSYHVFLQMAAIGLEINLESLPRTKPKIHRYSILKSVHIYKKHFRQYERRTYYLKCSVHKVTGSTASVFLEYIQRNLPEGVAMEVIKHQIEMLPEHLKPSIQTESVENHKQLE